MAASCRKPSWAASMLHPTLAQATCGSGKPGYRCQGVLFSPLTTTCPGAVRHHTAASRQPLGQYQETPDPWDGPGGLAGNWESVGHLWPDGSRPWRTLGNGNGTAGQNTAWSQEGIWEAEPRAGLVLSLGFGKVSPGHSKMGRAGRGCSVQAGLWGGGRRRQPSNWTFSLLLLEEPRGEVALPPASLTSQELL